jgi:Apolipoprotein A1/A4/E domain
MANHPKKLKDPTEEALSAIQDALSVRDEEAARSVSTPADAAADQRWPAPPIAIDDELFSDENRVDERAHERAAQPQEQPVPRRAANDDRQAIGQILQTIQRRPTRTSYVFATLFSAAWLVGALGLAWFYLPDLSGTISDSRVNGALIVGLGAVFLVPIIFFYAVAHMVWRSQELRLIAQSMAEVAIRLAEPETVARDSIVSVGQAIRREVAAMGDGVERALARAAELETLVSNEVSALERAYHDNEVRIRGLLQDLAGQRDTLVGQAEQVRNAITGVHLDLTHDISSISDLFTERVNEAANRITRTLADKGEHITSALGHASDRMIETLDERGGVLLNRLETTSEGTTRAIAGATERLTASLSFKTDHITEEFSDIAANLQQMMSTRLDRVTEKFAQKSAAVVDMMSSRSQQLTDAVIDTGTRLADTITTRVEEVNSTLKSTGDSLVIDLSLRGSDVVSQLEQTGAKITESLVARSDKVAESFRQSAEALVHTVGVRSDAVRDMLAARLQGFEEMFTNGGTELAERIGRDSSTLGNLITRHLAEFDRTVKTYGSELVERLGQRTDDVSQAMRQYVDNFDARVAASAEDITSAIDRTLGTKIDAIDKALGARTMQVTDTLDGRINKVEELLIGRAEAVASQIELRSKAAADALNGRLEQLSDSIKTNAGDAGRALGELATATSEAIRASASDAERTLTTVSGGLNKTLKENATEIERTLLAVSADVVRSFAGKAEEISSVVGQRAAEMTRILDDKSGGLLSALEGKSREFADDIGRVTENAVSAIQAKGFTFSQTMLDNSDQIARLINEASETATSAVTLKVKELHDATQSAIVQSKQTATATVADMLETHGMLRADSTMLFERLREASILLQEVLSGAHDNMGALEHTMVTRVSEFVSTMNELMEGSGAASNKIDEHITQFRGVTDKVLADLTDLSGQFESHGRCLAEAADLVESSNRRSDDSLEERRNALDVLVAALDTRTDDLERRLNRFSGLLDESLEAASGRARDIARMVAESSAQGSRAIAEQFDLVRSTSEEEGRRTGEALRAVYEQASGETHAIFRQSAEGFAEIVQGMKQMAAEMERELDATRAELRRGILELPKETADSAEQMRRVVVDQIEALAELNRIVARHGRALDVVDPARRITMREESAATSGAGRPEPLPRSQRDPANTPLPPRPDITGAAARRTEAPSLSPPQGNGRSGWLSDLLTRASRDEPEAPSVRTDDRPARHAIESLDSLSVDIARMIDHDAAAELWDRYRRGERNVFTRRLYTLQGQKAFDEIRKKYRADREFKQTVDRYISEFERLLDEVARDDRGQVVARTYLTSETGKVYTMLAHVAGRFD